jgi:hypothetical protein
MTNLNNGSMAATALKDPAAKLAAWLRVSGTLPEHQQAAEMLMDQLTGMMELALQALEAEMRVEQLRKLAARRNALLGNLLEQIDQGQVEYEDVKRHIVAVLQVTE